MIIKEIIKEKGLTINEVAERLNVSRQALSKQLNGNLMVDTLERIAKAIGCNVSDFFADESKDFCAFVKSGTEHYHADNIEELKGIITEIEKEDK